MSSEISPALIPMEHIDSSKDFASTNWIESQPNALEHPSSLNAGQHRLFQQPRFANVPCIEPRPKPGVAEDKVTCIPPDSQKPGSGMNGSDSAKNAKPET